MKFNKKTDKIIIEKKDHKQGILAYVGGYITNGFFLVKADLIELENELLQEKVNTNQPFSLYFNNPHELPDQTTWNNLISTPKGNNITITKLVYEDDYTKEKFNILLNSTSKRIIVMSNDCTKLLKSLEDKGTITQQILEDNDFPTITIHDSNNELLCIVSPYNNRKIIGDIMEIFNTIK